MALVRQASFHGGEVAPSLYGRTDLPNYDAALRTARNFIITPTGAAMNRPGFEHRVMTKVPATRGRLIPFTFSTSQSYVLEFGHQFVRVLQGGALVLNGGNPVELSTSYTAADLPFIQYVQSGDTMTLTCRGHDPVNLVRSAHASWAFVNVSLVRAQAAPTTLLFTVAPVTANDSTHKVKRWRWAVTAVATGDAGEESLPSLTLGTSDDNIIVAPDQPVSIGWTGASGAASYNVYRGRDGIYGYVGNSKTTTFTDEGQVPNYSDQPPTARNPFANGESPAVCAYHQQRRIFANQVSYPQRVLGSKTGAFLNFDYSLPQKDDDAIDFTVASRQYEEIRGLVSLRHLLIFTANGEFATDSGDGSPLTPTNVAVQPISSNGSSWVPPLIANNVVLYVQAQQSSVRQLAFDSKANGWGGSDISLAANHLLSSAGRTVVEWTYCRLPFSTLWAVRDDGALLSCCFSPDTEVRAWARHDTAGTFESVCSVPEGAEDVLYAIVNRSGSRRIERLASRVVLDAAQGNFLDASAWWSGAPRTTVPVTHLTGTVSALVDGVPYAGLAVTGGVVTLPVAGSTIFVGAPYDSDLELLDLTARGSEVHGQEKVVTKVLFEVDRAASLSAGQTLTELSPWVAPLGYSLPASGMDNETFAVPVMGGWNRGGRAALRQSQPLPVTVLAAVREVELGGV